MRAEREKRATILDSEGLRDSAINTAEGEKQKVIKESEATKQQQINEAEGESRCDQLLSPTATARGDSNGGRSDQCSPGGYQAVQLRVAEQYVEKLGMLAKENQHNDFACEFWLMFRR